MAEKDETGTLEKPATGKTIKYVITCDCYWNDILWHKDDRVELPADLKPLEYFKKVD